MAADRATAENLTRDLTSQAEGTAPAHPTTMNAAPLKREVSLDPAARRARKAYEGLSASSVGLEFGISVILGLLAGYYADRSLGSTPWLMLLGMAFGLTAGFRGVLRYVRKSDRQAEVEARSAAAGLSAAEGRRGSIEANEDARG